MVAAAGSPNRAAAAVEDCAAKFAADNDDVSPLMNERVLGLIVELAGSSSRAARLLSNDPELAVELAEQFVSFREEVDFDEELAHIVIGTHGDTDNFDRHLRRFRNRQMLRIALREIRNADVRHTAAELADMASPTIFYLLPGNDWFFIGPITGLWIEQ